MLCKEIVKMIEETYPTSAAAAWDNVGLLLGRTAKSVEKIYIALDATDEVIEAAISCQADMLITHHPMIFSPMKKITDEHFIGNRALKLLQHDIAYYAMHTNYDSISMAELAAKMLSMQDTEVLSDEENVGKVGNFACSMTVEECCELVKKAFHLSSVKVFGDLNRSVKRVAICPGSGKHMTESVIQKQAEVFITGDIDHHEGIDAVAQGITIIDAGHYGLEHIFIKDMAAYLEQYLENAEIVTAEISHPFQVI